VADRDSLIIDLPNRLFRPVFQNNTHVSKLVSDLIGLFPIISLSGCISFFNHLCNHGGINGFLGDIGLHFPDTDPKLKDISSMIILSKTYNILKNKGFTVINLDSTIMAEAPKITPFKATMEKNIARTIEIEPECVNVKATTLETLGMMGKGEGIAALCIALIE